MAQTVLVIDDEVMIRHALVSYLRQQGWEVFSAESGREALDIFARETISFVILDLMLPDLSGEEVCARLRQTSRVPVIMLTAKTAEEDLLNGLRIGADDYLTKPFSLKELAARMQVILRRSSADLSPLAECFSFNGDKLSVDFEQHLLKKNGEILSLTPSEWSILSALLKHPTKIYSREDLICLVFGDDSESYDRVIDTHVKNLRKKIEDDPKNPVYIKTVYGVGYKFGGEDA